MTSWRRAIGYGIIVWLVPFVIALAAFPVKEASRELFESIMPLSLSFVVVLCTLGYFSESSSVRSVEGLSLGLIWMAVSMGIDLPLMLSPPINYSLPQYLADIGLTYMMIPIITLGIARAAARPKSTSS